LRDIGYVTDETKADAFSIGAARRLRKEEDKELQHDVIDMPLLTVKDTPKERHHNSFVENADDSIMDGRP
jgi:hypothetical protein